MAWYSQFARFYDLATERLYVPYREQLFVDLALPEGARVLDVACGTGQNFPWLAPRLEALGGSLIGADKSPGMLARAARRVREAGWSCVELREVDARELTPDERFDAVVCTLGLSVVPDWEQVFARTFERLRAGGTYVVFDTWAERRNLQTWYVELIARADLRRRVWEPLERRGADFELRWLDASPWVFGGKLFAATGRAPATAPT